MKQRDVTKYLWDALNAARETRGFVAGLTIDEYLASRSTMLLVERTLEIVGEALRAASETHPALTAQISFLSQIIGLRNVLAHGYFALRHDRIWQVVNDDLPILIRELEALLPQ